MKNNLDRTVEVEQAIDDMHAVARHYSEINFSAHRQPNGNLIEDDKKHFEYEIQDELYKKLPNCMQKLSSFQVRLITGIAYLACMYLSFLGGEISSMIVLMLISGLSSGEFYYMVRSSSRLPNELIGITGAILYIPAMNYFGIRGVAIVTILMLLVLLVWYVFWMRAKISDVGVSLLGAVYTGGFLSGFMYIIRAVDAPYSSFALLIIFTSVCANDSFAYLIGSMFGKHKLAPRTSPKKSWEGFFAGLIGCAAIWCLFAIVPGFYLPIETCIFMGLVNGLFMVLGDLAESRVKRNSGFKDSGFILPGHGGLLDRCDSLFLASVTSVALFLVCGVIPLG